MLQIDSPLRGSLAVSVLVHGGSPFIEPRLNDSVHINLVEHIIIPYVRLAMGGSSLPERPYATM
jgi:hypothetical protein